jgi:hypothetical protein
MSFDPTQPFEVEGGGFDPSQPFEVEGGKGPGKRYTNPNAGKSKGQMALAGAKRFIGDAGLGAVQLMARGLDALGNERGAEDVAKFDNIAENRKLDPTMRSGAAQVGYTGAALVPAVASAFIPGANTATGAALIGGGMGALQPTGEGDSRAMNVAGGAAAGAAGQGLFNAVGRVAQPVKTALNAAETRAVQLLRTKGVSLSVGQQTGSRAAQSVERTLADNPASAQAMARQGERFKQSYTRAALRTVGESAESATPEVLGRAAKRIGNVFSDVSGRYQINLGEPAVAKALKDIEDEASRVLLGSPGMHGMPGTNQISAQLARIRDVAAKNGGKLPGETAQAVRSELQKLAKQPAVSEYAVELREILDDALLSATKGTEDFSRLQTARSQYRNLQAIADVADTTANAYVTPGALAQRLKNNKYTKNSMRFGRGDVELAKIARAGSTVVDRFPNSGTAARGMAQLGVPAAMGGLGYMATGDVGTAAKIAGATWAIPKAGGAFMTNPAVQNYLSSGVAQPLVRNALGFPGQAGLGSMVPAYLLSQE